VVRARRRLGEAEFEARVLASIFFRISSAGAITSGPMPSPGSTAMWKAVLADMGTFPVRLFFGWRASRLAANEYGNAAVRKG
jgi:hypothetical protein